MPHIPNFPTSADDDEEKRQEDPDRSIVDRLIIGTRPTPTGD